MKLKDFKEWLNQFPDDTIVETVDVSWEYDGACATFTPFDPNYHSNYLEMSGSPDIKPGSEFYNKRFLELGSI